MTDTLSADGPLPLARRRLDDAVHAIVDPVPVWFNGAALWQASLYTRLRTELEGGRTVRRRVAIGSRSPCHVGILTWLCEVDTTVTGWEPNGKDTGDRLHELTGRSFRPQDCALIEDYCAQIERWVLAGVELLDPPVAVHLPQPCPRCGARHAYRRDSAGEDVRTRAALKVSENGCTCLACGSFWAPQEFHWLARTLGVEPLTA